MERPKDFSELLNRYMERVGCTPGQLSKQSGIPKQTIVNWQQGIVKKPRSWRKLVQLAKLLDLNEQEVSDMLQVVGYPSITELITYNRNNQDKELLSDWKPERDKVTIKIREALSETDYKTQIETLCCDYSVAQVCTLLTEIALNIEENEWIQVRAFEELVRRKAIKQSQWDAFLRIPKTKFVKCLIDVLAKSNVILNKEQVQLLFQNSGLPLRTSGLGEMVVAFINRGADYTSAVFTPAASCFAWQIRHNCVKSIIELDDADALTTLLAFIKTTSYNSSRRNTIRYISHRFETNRLLGQDLDAAKQILVTIVSDGKTNIDSTTMTNAKKLLEML